MALTACRNPDDALDLVQDAMCRFVEKYSSKPAEQWKPLFYKILHNRIHDLYRRQALRGKWFFRFKEGGAGEEPESRLEQVPGPRRNCPDQQHQVQTAFERLQVALRQLPFRQQQVFHLRCWEELSVADTAKIMGCSEGSVKTHYSRATRALREGLGDYWP